MIKKPKRSVCIFLLLYLVTGYYLFNTKSMYYIVFWAILLLAVGISHKSLRRVIINERDNKIMFCYRKLFYYNITKSFDYFNDQLFYSLKEEPYNLGVQLVLYISDIKENKIKIKQQEIGKEDLLNLVNKFEEVGIKRK